MGWVDAGRSRTERRDESQWSSSGCDRNGWLARGQRSAVSSTSGKGDGSLAGLGMDGQWDGRWARWVTCRGHLSQRSEAHLISRFIISAGLVMARGACVSTSDCVPRMQSVPVLLHRRIGHLPSFEGCVTGCNASASAGPLDFLHHCPVQVPKCLAVAAAGLVSYLIRLRLHSKVTPGMYMTSPLRFRCIILN